MNPERQRTRNFVSEADIDRALDEIIAREEGFRFQRLATILAQQRWPELIASEPKKDLGADARVSGALAANAQGKALACSLTAKFSKVRDDAKEIRRHFPDTRVLIFATARPVSNQTAERWSNELRNSLNYDELIVMTRADIVSALMQPQNTVICRTILHIPVDIEADLSALIDKVRQVSAEMTAEWFGHRRLAGQPLIELRAVTLERDGPGNILTGETILNELRQGRRVIIEAPAGRGKTTTLIQLAKRFVETNEIAFLIDMPEWAKSVRDLLQYIGDVPRCRANGIPAEDLARVSCVQRFSFLFNGWNELPGTVSEGIENQLRKIDREFPTAGIAVATRLHSMRPPLATPLRVGLLPLSRNERSEYLRLAVGPSAADLAIKLESKRALDELTRTPFILHEVTKLFLADRALPTTKIGILQSVTDLLEDQAEHWNALRRKPLSGNASTYLAELAIGMVALNDVTIAESQALKYCNCASRALVKDGQLSEIPEPRDVLDALCSHHVFERIEYPALSFRFEHQQFQEFYAALWLDHRFSALVERHNSDATAFIADFINMPSWDEPLRMLAEKIGTESNEDSSRSEAIARGNRLIDMALQVDPIFAADLARLTAGEVWQQVGHTVGQRIRSWYSLPDESHRHCALAAMFATGSADFSDITLPLLTSEDQNVRLQTYRTATEFHLSSLGTDWRTLVGKWNEQARVEFVSELAVYQRRVDVAEYFSFNDPSTEVRIEAAKFLSWIGATEQLIKALEGLPQPALDAGLLRLHREEIPPSFVSHTLAAYQRQLTNTNDPLQRIRIILAEQELGAPNTADVLKSELAPLQSLKTDFHKLTVLNTALEVIQKTDPQWVSEWVAGGILSGMPWHDSWKDFVKSIPDTQKDELLNTLASEDLGHRDRQIIAVLSLVADVPFVEQLFSRLCTMQREIDASARSTPQTKYRIYRQLQDLFRLIAPTVSVPAISRAFNDDFDEAAFRIIIELFAVHGRDESDLRNELSDELRQGFRRYLKRGIPFACQQDDFSGRLLADLASSLARIGEREDINDLRTLIEADLERWGRIKEARVRGEHVHGTRWSRWHLEAVVSLDREQAESILLSLLGIEEYEVDAANVLLRLATIDKGQPGIRPRKSNYEQIWEARAGQRRTEFIEDHRRRFSAALRDRVSAVFKLAASSSQPEQYSYRLEELAVVIAALDSQGSAGLLLNVIELPARRGGWRRVDVLKQLIFNGINVPAEAALRILNPIIARQLKDGLYNDSQGQWLLLSALCLLPFIDSPGIGISRVREVVQQTGFPRYDLSDLISALGHSRSPEALNFLFELAEPDGKGIEGNLCAWIEAVANLGGPEATQLLMAFIDPPESGFLPQISVDSHDGELLASKIADVARSDRDINRRLFQLPAEDLTPERRHLLFRALVDLGTPDAIFAALDVVNDGTRQQIPYELLKVFENLFLEHRPYGTSGNAYTVLSRSSNEIRQRLFRLLITDGRRRNLAFSILGQIELWRLEHGRPPGEPRHPSLESGVSWPPLELFVKRGQ